VVAMEMGVCCHDSHCGVEVAHITSTLFVHNTAGYFHISCSNIPSDNFVDNQKKCFI